MNREFKTVVRSCHGFISEVAFFVLLYYGCSEPSLNRDWMCF